MSVEKEGPKGYEYQYLVSTLLALEFIDRENFQVFIESENGEDLQVQFDENGKRYIIDIQVKKRNHKIDIKEFSKWISHFEERSTDKNLFTKLLSNKERYVLFVTNSRCNDEVSIFTKDNVQINKSLDIGISNDLLEKIKMNVINCYTDSTNMSKERQEFLKLLFAQINKNELRLILKKNKVWDFQDTETVYNKAAIILNKKFFVPQSKIEGTILELIDVIRLGRDVDYSISSHIMKLLKKYKATRIFDYDNKLVNRIEKDSCTNTLHSKNILLLTGVSFCGKTFLAREIAQDYQDKGYTIKITDSLHGDNGGLAFFRHNSNEDKLLILEDPFGQIITKDNAIEIVSNVKKLIENCDIHKKLIITSRKDILFDALGKDTLNECKIYNNWWYDLTVSESNIGKQLWESYFGKSEQSKAVFDKVIDWLSKKEKIEFLQPGQLAHLNNSLSNVSELEKMNEIEIISLARVDSNDLSQKIHLRGNYCKYLYIALGLSCNTYKPIHLNDLAFILSNSKESPSINYKTETYIEYSVSKDIEETKYPTYHEKYKIQQEYIEELKYLKNHGYIKLDNLTKMIIFTHPIYHFASNILFLSSINDLFESDEVKKIVNRSLTALSKGANICTLMMLESYYLETNNQEIKSMMLKGLNSIYPSVRDRVIMFFDGRINELYEEEAKNFVSSIKFLITINDDVLLWKDGDPYFNNLTKRNLITNILQKYDVDNINIIKEKLEQKEVLTSEEMWTILNFAITEENFTLKQDILIQCLSYDEVFIREKAIYHLFENYAFNFTDIKKYLDCQEHPYVIYKLFRGSLSSWDKYNSTFKREILNFFKSTLNIVSVTIRSLKFLENFEDEYSTDGIRWSELKSDDIKELWCVWYEVFIELLDKFPSKYIEMNEPHMVTVARASLNYITEEVKIVELTKAWINWLEKYSEHYMAHDYGMSVADYLLEGTKENYEVRKDVFNCLISSPKTSFITTNIKNLIDYWDYLSPEEKQKVVELLNSERKDLKWLRAVVLNRRVVPAEVQIAIFGEVLFKKDINQINDTLIKYNLLEYCINVHCGFPQPLWWNGYHHNNYKLWDKIILNVLKGDLNNRTFQISLMEFLDYLYNHGTKRFNDGYKFLEENILNNSTKRENFFYRLLIETISQNQVNKRLWDMLFQYSCEDEKSEYYNTISKNIEAIQYFHSNYEDLFCLFDEKVIFNEIYPRLVEDFTIYKFCNSQLEFYRIRDELGIQDEEMDQKVIEVFKGYIKGVYEVNPPRMSLTNNFVLYTMRKLNVDDKEIKEKIELNRKRHFQIREKIASEFNDHYELEDWFE